MAEAQGFSQTPFFLGQGRALSVQFFDSPGLGIRMWARFPQRAPLSRFPTPLRPVHATEEGRRGDRGRSAWLSSAGRDRGNGADGLMGAGQGLPVTFLVHCLTVLISSEITMSTHLRHGSRIFFTCFFTMVSKAMSGVNSPVLNARSRRRAQCYRLALARSARPGSLSSP